MTKTYLARIERYRKRYNFTLYGYVSMSNHVHLLIQTGKVPLSKIMQGIQGGFTQRWPRLGGRTSGLWKRVSRSDILTSFIRLSINGS